MYAAGNGNIIHPRTAIYIPRLRPLAWLGILMSNSSRAYARAGPADDLLRQLCIYRVLVVPIRPGQKGYNLVTAGRVKMSRQFAPPLASESTAARIRTRRTLMGVRDVHHCESSQLDRLGLAGGNRGHHIHPNEALSMRRSRNLPSCCRGRSLACRPGAYSDTLAGAPSHSASCPAHIPRGDSGAGKICGCEICSWTSIMQQSSASIAKL